MTPCEEKGYEVGQVFEVISDRYQEKIVVLDVDDGTFQPEFISLPSRRVVVPHLCDVKRIYPPERTKMVKVICEGKETEISRESAKALNLI